MSPLRIRNAEPREYARVGDLTIAAYAALPVDHLWGGYADEIRDVAGRAAAADVLVAVDHADDADDAVLGAVTLVTDPTSPWLEWTEPGEVQFRLLAVDPEARGRGTGEALVRECLDARGCASGADPHDAVARGRATAVRAARLRPPPRSRRAVRGVARPGEEPRPAAGMDRRTVPRVRLAQLMYR